MSCSVLTTCIIVAALAFVANAKSLKPKHIQDAIHGKSMTNTVSDSTDALMQLTMGVPKSFKCKPFAQAVNGQLYCGDSICFVRCDKCYKPITNAAFAYQCIGTTWKMIPGDAPKTFDICRRRTTPCGGGSGST